MSTGINQIQDFEINTKTILNINSMIHKKDVELNFLRNKIKNLEIRLGCVEQENNNIISEIKNYKNNISSKIQDIEFVICELKDVLFFKISSREEITKHQDMIDWISFKNNRNSLKNFFNQNNKQNLKKFIIDQIEKSRMTPFEITNIEDETYSFCGKYIGNVQEFDNLINWLNENSFVLVKILDEDNVKLAVKKVIENGFMTPFR